MDSSISIYKATPQSDPLIKREINGCTEYALNGRDLAGEAVAAIEPELRHRWTLYWRQEARKASIALNGFAAVDEVMNFTANPRPYYPCPPELAVKIIWPSSEPEPALLVESCSKE
jgi:post-segregation antitoxin (ccd killing protein)